MTVEHSNGKFRSTKQKIEVKAVVVISWEFFSFKRKRRAQGVLITVSNQKYAAEEKKKLSPFETYFYQHIRQWRKLIWMSFCFWSRRFKEEHSKQSLFQPILFYDAENN